MLNELLDRIETKRKALGLTQVQLAERAGLSTDVIRNIQRAAKGDETKVKRKGLTTHTVIQLADALGEPPEWIMFGVGRDCSGSSINTRLHLDLDILVEAITRLKQEFVMQKKGMDAKTRSVAIALAYEETYRKKNKLRPLRPEEIAMVFASQNKADPSKDTDVYG